MRAVIVAALLLPVVAEASPADHCLAQLDAKGVSYRPASRSGIAIGVEITGPLGGVVWASTAKTPLGTDGLLAVALSLCVEQGLAYKVDCLGQPATQAGAILKVMQCQLARSGLFYLVLSPD